jgi:hypothetical protein
MKNYMKMSLMIMLLMVMLGCSGYKPSLEPEGPYWVDNDKQEIPEPSSKDPNLAWMSIKRSSFDQIEDGLDLERNFRILSDEREEAANINSFDEVPNSTWFTNRHGFSRMTPAEIARGVDLTPGPDTSGPWLVFRPKVQGTTPGFWIEDSRGDQYVIKFDPKGYPEMATAAAAMASRYLHACGYNVPQETIIYYRPEILRVKEGVTFEDNAGAEREFTQQDLEDILKRVHHEPDGRIRSLASLSLGIHGKIKGPFSYSGTRSDDPNDWFNHQDRRELRGLYVIGSFINHYDLKDQNSLDIYVEENGNRFLKHFLIDFGSTFGSDGQGPKPPVKGYANMIDLRDAFVSLITVGIKTWDWRGGGEVIYPSIGYFEADIFQPDKFDPIYPNPAFEDKTDRDCYWGAKIVTAFRDDDLQALIENGQYSNPEAEEYLFETLKRRRDKIGRFWFSKVNPLDYFEIEYVGNDFKITFDDLGVEYGLWPENAVYNYEIRYRGQELVLKGKVENTEIALTGEDLDKMASAFEASDKKEDYIYRMDIRTARGNGDPGKPTRLHFWYHPDEDRFSLVGIEHAD